MDRIISRTKRFLFAKQSSIVSSAMLLGLMIVISRLFGFFRYRILAGYFSKEDLDIFFASFRIPDLIFEILITGALISSFIPIYVRYQKNKEELTANISSIINIINILMVALIIFLYVIMDWLMRLITPGFPEKKLELTILFARYLLLGQLPFMIVGNFLTGIAQSEKTFLLSSIAPVIYNLAIIATTVFFAGSLGLYAPVWGVVLGAVLFFIIQLPILINGSFRYRFIIKKTAGVKEFFKVIVPRTVTVIVAQIDATIDLTLTSLLGAGSYTVFYLAQHLQLLPVSVVGIAFGQASLPYLSELYEEGKHEELKRIIITSLLNMLFLTIPFASFFIFARTPVVRLFFGGQKFDWDATVSTALTLSLFSVALPFHSVYYFLTRCFYALLDSRTPFFISVASVAINTILSLLFIIVFKLPVWSLAISFSVAMIINVVFLMIFLYYKIGQLDLNFLAIEAAKIIVATFISSIPAYYLIRFLDRLVLDTSRTINVFLLLFLSGSLYILLYLFLGWLLNIKEMFLLTRLMLRAKEYQKRIFEFYAGYE